MVVPGQWSKDGKTLYYLNPYRKLMIRDNTRQ